MRLNNYHLIVTNVFSLVLLLTCVVLASCDDHDHEPKVFTFITLHLSLINQFPCLYHMMIMLYIMFCCLQVYIVYLGEHSGEKTFQEIEDFHHSYLHSVKGSKKEVESCIIYSYKNVINGFSALLTPQEADKISST